MFVVEGIQSRGWYVSTSITSTSYIYWLRSLYGIFSWESIDSFDGSESLIAEFWEQTPTQGRDIHDLTLFQLGENFFWGMKKETES